MHNPTPSPLIPPQVGQSLFFSSFGGRQVPGIAGMNGADAAIQGQVFGGRSSYNSLFTPLFADQTAEDQLEELEEINSTQGDIKDLLGAIYLELLKLNQTTLEGN